MVRAELHSVVRARMRDLGLTVSDVAVRSRRDRSTIGDLVNGRRANFSDETKRLIEAALEWEDGSLDDIAAGTNPRDDGGLGLVLAAWPELSEDVRRAIVAACEAARQPRRRRRPTTRRP